MLTAGLERPALVLNTLLLLVLAVVTVAGAPALGVTGIATASALGSLGYAAVASLIIRLRLGANTTVGAFFGSLISERNNTKVATHHAG